MIASLAIGHPVLKFISRPVEDQLMEYWTRYYDAKIEDELKKSPDRQVKIPPVMLDLDELARRLNLPKLSFMKNPVDEKAFKTVEPFQKMFQLLGIENKIEPKLGVMYLEPDRGQLLKWFRDVNLDLKPPLLRRSVSRKPFWSSSRSA